MRWPRRFCCDEDLALIGYDGRDAARDLVRWRNEGPRPTTAELINVLRRQGVEGATILDIGAGVGTIHTSLLEAGAARAVDVDASREYLQTAREEAQRKGIADRVEYRYGDVVELADELPPSDVVTLDSVICCYPYLSTLLGAAVRSRPRLVGITYPRDTWWMVAWMRLYNAIETVRRTMVRYFIHRHADVRQLMADAGYSEIHDGGSPAWRVVVYEHA